MGDISLRQGTYDGVGVAGAVRTGHKAYKLYKGITDTTKLGKAFDIGTSVVGLATASGNKILTKTVGAAKNAAGLLKSSGSANIASVASKAAPILSKAGTVFGVAVGAWYIASGIHELAKDDGNAEKGKEKIVGGTCDIISSVALHVAAGSAATGIGAPVAAVATGVAAVAQGAKYVYKYKDEIKEFAGSVINKGTELASKAFDTVTDWFS